MDDLQDDNSKIISSNYSNSDLELLDYDSTEEINENKNEINDNENINEINDNENINIQEVNINEKKMVNKLEIYLSTKKNNQINIMNRLFSFLDTEPVFSEAIPVQIDNIEYDHFIKLWLYYKKIHYDKFKKRFPFVDKNDLTEDEIKFYGPFFEKFKVLNQLFNAHVGCDEHLILFHLKNNEHSFFKLHSEKLWNDFYGNCDKNDIYRYYDSLTQMPYWNIEINTPGIKESFIQFLRNSEHENCVYISCFIND